MGILDNKNFLVMWIGQLATIFGNRFSEIAIPLIVLQLTGSAWHAALVVVCSQIAPLLLSLPAGNWVEERSKRSIAMAADLVSFTAMSLLVFFVLTDEMTIWILALGLFVLGGAGVFFRLSFGAMVPGVAGRDNLVQAHTYIEGADAISTLTGPVMAGIVLSTFGIGWALTIDAATFLISLAGIFFLSFKEKRRPAKKQKLKWKTTCRSSLEGLRLMVGNSFQSFITFNHAVLNFTTTAVTLTVIVYTSSTLQFSEWQTGIVLSAAGAGNLVGVLVMNRIQDLSWKGLYGGLMIVSGLGLFFILTVSQLPLISLGMFLFDGALSLAFVVNGAARQAVTPDHYLARIGGGGMLLGGIVAISGNLFSGGISEALDPRAVLGFCGLLLMIAAVVSFNFKEGKRPIHQLEPKDHNLF